MVQRVTTRLDTSFGALSDATRRGILEQLGRADASITDLAETFHMTLTGMKKHVGVLEQAGLVTTEKVGRGHRYLPAMVKGDYETFALDQVVDKVFDGQPLSLVRRLVDTAGLGRRELASLKAMLDAKERPKGR